MNKGRRYAVLIGSSRFDKEPNLNPLKCPENDVDGMREILAAAELGAFEEPSVFKNADSFAVMHRIEETLSEATGADQVLIYYSGHGKTDLPGRLYLATANTEIKKLVTTSIPIETLRLLIENSSCRKIMLILDCCYGGAVGKSFTRGDVDDKFKELARGNGVYILTASTASQTAQEREGDDYGLLTKHIISGIKQGAADANDDGLVSMDDLYQYVYAKVKSEGYQEPMRWALNVKGEDLIIARASGVSIRELKRLLTDKIIEIRSSLPSRIFTRAIQAIEDRRRPFYEIVSRLRLEQWEVGRFIEEWDQVEAGEQRQPPASAQTPEQQEAQSDKTQSGASGPQPSPQRMGQGIENLAAEPIKKVVEDPTGIVDWVTEVWRSKNWVRRLLLLDVLLLALNPYFIQFIPAPFIPDHYTIYFWTVVVLFFVVALIISIRAKAVQPAPPPAPQKITDAVKELQPEKPVSPPRPEPQPASTRPDGSTTGRSPRPALPDLLTSSRRKRLFMLIILGLVIVAGVVFVALLPRMGWFKTDNSGVTTSSNTRMLEQAPSSSPLARMDFETVTLDPQGKEVDRRKLWAEYFTEDLNGVPLEMVKVPSGTFEMGSPNDEADRDTNEGLQHSVTVPEFFMGRFEVTLEQWRQVANMPRVKIDLKKEDLSNFKDSLKQPVARVSWEEAVEFCERLKKKTGKPYRLPSEAEWEYGARAGTKTPFAFGPTITPKIVNYNGNYPYGSAPKGAYRQKTVEVGSLGVANAFGLSDMHCNVWEWCEDVWHDDYKGAPSDGSAWLSGGDSTRRVLRGGSWNNEGRHCRSAIRGSEGAGIRRHDHGFRVVVAARTR